jgi:hypothetical protein
VTPSVRRLSVCFSVAASALAASERSASAHTIAVTPYDLPIPFRVYVYACAATLLLTFVALAFVAGSRSAPAPPPRLGLALGRVLPAIGQVGAMALLGLTVAAGLWGTPSPVANIAPTLFWVGMMLGLTAVTAVLGDVFQIVNPWHSLTRLLHVGGWPLLRYPSVLAHWPAFICYLALEWLELMAAPRPSLLAWALIVYTGLTLAGVALFGRVAWFERAELFGVFFRLVGTLAPFAYNREDATGGRGWRARWRPPLSGALDDVPRHISLLLFVLFMLAATTYDGVWRTSFWAGLYWSNLMQWLRPLWGDDTARAQTLLAPGYIVYQRGGLIAAPFAYLAVYMAAMDLMGVLTRARAAARMLALRFAFTIIPIAVVNMLAHSWTLLLTVIPVVPFLLTDPFGAGWNMLALSRMSAEADPLDMGQVWHVEVALILAGHVAGVYLAHRVALGTFATRRQAWISELPLLLVMMGYTFIGLTVLSLPLALH